jgi:pimeloyl-ACP methyl ester carboxylesterase
METVTHHDRETAYRVSDRGGSGRPLLCVHGSGGNHAVWKSQFRLGDERPIVTIDLSGHGESTDIDADPGYETLSAYADDVLAVAEETGAGVFAGNSMGGAILLHLALERDDFRPEGLVLAGTGAKLAVLDDLLTWLQEDFDRALEFLHAPDRFLHDPDERLVEMSREAMLDAGQEVVSRDFRSCHEFDVRDRVGEIDVPTLAVVGEHDKLTPARYHEFFVEEMPNAELAVIDDAAHLAMLERPEPFNAAVGDFMDSL